MDHSMYIHHHCHIGLHSINMAQCVCFIIAVHWHYFQVLDSMNRTRIDTMAHPSL